MVYKIARRKRRAHRRRNPRFGVHRPTLIFGAGGWHRPGKKGHRRSRLFKRATRINARKRRHAVRHATRHNPRRMFRHYRRNPSIPFAIDKVAIGGLKVAGGLIAGSLGMSVLGKFMPATVTAQYGKFYGAIHIVAGAVAAATLKNKMIKDVALIVAASGVYDLIASNVSFLGLPPLPRSNPLLGKTGDEPGVVGVGASYQQIGTDYEPALGASYQQVGVDDISYGGDSIELD
jgi:hypothetical protein